MYTTRSFFLRFVLSLIIVALVLMPAHFKTQSASSPKESLTQNQATLTKDGARNPASIPDYVAYEFFFRSLITSPAEGTKGQRRVDTFARQPGLNEAQASALLTEVQNIQRRISAFDKKIKAIKDRTWPDPQPEVLAQLREIQRAKEAAIMDESTALLNRKDAKVSSALAQFISTYVKARIKGYAAMAMTEVSPQMHHHHAPAVKPLSRGSFVPVSQMEETVYIYSNTVYNHPDPYVCSWADVQATGGSYGHEYSPKIDLFGPSGQYISTEGGFSIMDLCEGEDCDDGVFIAIVTAIVFCPILNGTFNNGNGDSSTVVNPFIRVNPFGTFSPNPINEGINPSSISLSITASANANANVNIEPSYIVVSGAAPISISATVSGGPNFSITRGTTVSKTLSYSPINVTTNPTRIRAEAVVSANVNVINSNPQSTSTLTINAN